MERVSLLVGGRSTEHDASLHSYSSLVEDYQRYSAPDIEIVAVYYLSHHKEAFRHSIQQQRDFPIGEFALSQGERVSHANLISELLQSESFIFSLLHGNEGEDGAFQGVAEIFDIPGNFGSTYASCIGMHKWTQSLVASAVLRDRIVDIDTLLLRVSAPDSILREAVSHFAGRPCIVKPNSMGASLLTSVTSDLTLDVLRGFLNQILPFDQCALVQERILGREFTCGCLRTSDSVVALPIIEAVTMHGFLGHDEKHSGDGVTPILHPDSTGRVKTIQEISVLLFDWMEYPDMCRFDFMMDGEDRIYFLEANTLPGLMVGSAYPKMLQVAGFSLTDVVRFSIANYRSRRRREKVLRYVIAD